jgi:two-component system response regulator ArlR
MAPSTLEEAIIWMDRESYDIFIVDDEQVNDACREIRKTSNAPIMILSKKDTELDNVIALELGADGYETKPYSVLEVMARINAMLRRSKTPINPKERVIRAGDYVLLEDKRQIKYLSEVLTLTLKEYNLLRLFIINNNIALERTTILEHAWGWDTEVTEDIISVYINALRKKINPDHLITIRGVGYIFNG